MKKNSLLTIIFAVGLGAIIAVGLDLGHRLAQINTVFHKTKVDSASASTQTQTSASSAPVNVLSCAAKADALKLLDAKLARYIIYTDRLQGNYIKTGEIYLAVKGKERTSLTLNNSYFNPPFKLGLPAKGLTKSGDMYFGHVASVTYHLSELDNYEEISFTPKPANSVYPSIMAETEYELAKWTRPTEKDFQEITDAAQLAKFREMVLIYYQNSPAALLEFAPWYGANKMGPESSTEDWLSLAQKTLNVKAISLDTGHSSPTVLLSGYINTDPSFTAIIRDGKILKFFPTINVQYAINFDAMPCFLAKGWTWNSEMDVTSLVCGEPFRFSDTCIYN